MKEKKKGGDELDLTFNIVDYFGFVVKTWTKNSEQDVRQSVANLHL